MTDQTKQAITEIKTLNADHVTNKDRLWKLIWGVFSRDREIGGGLIKAYKWLWEQDLNQSFNQEVFHILNQELIRGLSDTDNLPDMTVSSYAIRRQQPVDHLKRDIGAESIISKATVQSQLFTTDVVAN